MVKVISSNEKRGTAQVVIITEAKRGKRTVRVSRTRHLMFDGKAWRDSLGHEVKLTESKQAA